MPRANEPGRTATSNECVGEGCSATMGRGTTHRQHRRRCSHPYHHHSVLRRRVKPKYIVHPPGWALLADKKNQPSIAGDVEKKPRWGACHLQPSYAVQTRRRRRAQQGSILWFFYSRASKAAALGAGSGAVVYGSKKAISTATRKKGTHHHVETSPTGQATGEEWLIPFLAKQLFQR